jgi:hypothetical protein
MHGISFVCAAACLPHTREIMCVVIVQRLHVFSQDGLTRLIVVHVSAKGDVLVLMARRQEKRSDLVLLDKTFKSVQIIGYITWWAESQGVHAVVEDDQRLYVATNDTLSYTKIWRDCRMQSAEESAAGTSGSQAY